METNLMQLKELFHLEDQDLRSYSPLTLAYIGDGVYELVIRTILVKKGICPASPHGGHRTASTRLSVPTAMTSRIIILKRRAASTLDRLRISTRRRL